MTFASCFPVFAVSLLAGLAACSSDAATGTSGGGAPKEGSVRELARPGSERSDDLGTRGAPDMTPRDARVEGTPGIRVTWEALAGELAAMKRSKQPLQIGFGQVQEFKVVLLNQSHPDAPKVGQRKKEAGTTVVSDQDMNDLMQGLEQEGFFRYAQPTGSLERLFENEKTRGRITVERGSESVTLLSQRLMGLDPRTAPIPKLYSDAKAAVSMMRNRTPTMSIDAYGAEPVHPKIPGAR